MSEAELQKALKRIPVITLNGLLMYGFSFFVFTEEARSLENDYEKVM